MENGHLLLASDLLLRHPELLSDTPPAAVKGYTLYIAEQTVDALARLAEESDSVVQRNRANRALLAIAHAGSGTRIAKPSFDWENGRDYALATNQPSLLARAYLHEIPTVYLDLPEPQPNTGIRYLLVPDDFRQRFAAAGSFTESELREYLPEEEPFRPNEYVVLYAAEYQIDTRPRRLSPTDEIVEHTPMGAEEYGRYIARFHAPREFRRLQYFTPEGHDFPRDTPALAAYYDALRDPDIDCIVAIGPAGSGKTYSAMSCMREGCINGTFIHAYILAEGKNPLGAVKGGVEEKMAPKLAYARDALRSAELKTHSMRKKLQDLAKHGEGDGPSRPRSVHEQIEDTVQLQWGRNFTSVPYELATGRTFEHSAIIVDEAQRIPYELLDTLISRPGQGSKLIVMGDYAQVTPGIRPEQSGLAYASLLLTGLQSAAFIELSTVLRSDIAAAVVKNRDYARQQMGFSL